MPLIKKIFLAIAVFTSAICAASIENSIRADTATPDTIRFTVTKTGRKILLDGFLMEWRTESARTWDSAGAWLWDVVATSEGLAGYLRLQKPQTCSSGVLSMRSSIDSVEHIVTMPSTDPDEAGEHRYLRFDRREFDSTKTITVEWLFPYGKEIPNLTTPMTLTFNGHTSCGDTLPVLILSYTPQPVKTGTKLTMVGQGLLIVILALLYFAIQRKIRLQTQRQKESPHQ